MNVKLLAVSVALAAIALASCGDDEDADAPPTSTGGIPGGLTTILVLDNRFMPLDLQVPVGTEVTWQWDSQANHSIVGTFYDKEVRSETQSGKSSFKFAFEQAGVLEYHCGVHGPSMAGKVTLQ